mgnify:CR=1 FL=1
MPKAKTYKTHTGLLIYQTQDEGEHVVAIVGDREKELLRTPSRAAATKYFNELKKQYEASSG